MDGLLLYYWKWFRKICGLWGCVKFWHICIWESLGGRAITCVTFDSLESNLTAKTVQFKLLQLSTLLVWWTRQVTHLWSFVERCVTVTLNHFEPEPISTDWNICADCPLCCGNILHSKTPQFKLTASLFFPVRLYRSLSFGAPDLTQKYNSGEAAGAGGGTEFRCPPAFWAHQQCWGGMYKPVWGPTSTNWISPVQHPLVTTRIGEAGRAKPWRCTVHKWSEHILRPAREISWKLTRIETATVRTVSIKTALPH